QLKPLVTFSVTAPGADLPVRPAVLLALAQSTLLSRNRLPRRSRTCSGLQPPGREVTESAAPGREGPCRSGQRLQAQAGRTRLGEAEARARAHPRRRLSRVAGTSGLGGGIRDRARRALRPVRVRLRRRLAPKVSRRYWPGIQATAYLSSYFAGGRG